MSELAPKLKEISVAPEKLILDPNNPRLISKDADQRNESEALDLLDETLGMMRDGHFKIEELENSIKQNGWWPIDFIFVKKHDNDGRYIVLEGNRRVTAIRNIRKDDTADPDLKSSLDNIIVMEITDDIPIEELKNKITYLLGVRHHGSLKKWSPFAQAHNIYLRYLALTNMTTESFIWETNNKFGHSVADALSIDFKDVYERLRVYRAMEQIGNIEHVKQSEANGAGMKDRYYSVCREVLLSSNNSLQKYIYQDARTFLLNDESVNRIINLCHFDQVNRDNAPINNPQQWRKLANILEDLDPTERERMLEEVEINKSKPSDVWAQRSAQLQKLQWDKWLDKVNTVIKRVTLGDDLNSEAAVSVVKKLLNLINKLENR